MARSNTRLLYFLAGKPFLTGKLLCVLFGLPKYYFFIYPLNLSINDFLLQDTFFYCLVFDPTQKTLLADKGEIRVGSRYQTELQHLLKDDETDGRKIEELETLVWTPHHNLTDRKIDQFLVVSRSVGTFARALDCSSSVKQPSLHMSAAAASSDITLVSSSTS